MSEELSCNLIVRPNLPIIGWETYFCENMFIKRVKLLINKKIKFNISVVTFNIGSENTSNEIYIPTKIS